jgi:hypothetical protein
VPRDDGSAQEIFRCPSCRVAVYSRYGHPGVYFVRAGTLDEPATVSPDVGGAAPRGAVVRGLLRHGRPLARGQPRACPRATALAAATRATLALVLAAAVLFRATPAPARRDIRAF